MDSIALIFLVSLGNRDVTAREIEAQRIKNIIPDHRTVIMGRDSWDELLYFYDCRSQKIKKMIKTLKGNLNQVGYGNEC